MANTATRLITLIMLLQQRPNQKASTLAHELGISVRTLHRYLAMLDDMGIPIYSERGPHGGFSLVRGYKLPPLVFTPEEAVALYLGICQVRALWGELYCDAASGALAKLQNILPEEQQAEVAWARRALVTTHMHRADFARLIPLLEKLRRATREHRCVTMLYQSHSRPNPLERVLDPYALVFRWGWWYVVGYCHVREEIRSFRVDRIIELALSDQPFSMPDEFNVYDYLASELESEQSGILVRLRFTPEAAVIARGDMNYWDTLEEQPDGSVIVSFKTTELEYTAHMAMGFGPGVLVLEPEELRKLVAEKLRATADQYYSL